MSEIPSALRAEHTVVQANVNGCAIAIGQERISAESTPNNHVSMGVRVEWVLALQLPPSCMKRLQRQLSEIVANYEVRFGVIPEDLPAPPRPTLAAFNPEVVSQTSPERPPEGHPEVDAGVRQEPYQPSLFSRLFDSEGRLARRPPPIESPPIESSSSPSSPTA